MSMRQEAVDFVAQHLQKHPDISMSELKELAANKNINVYPLIIGLARKQLGLPSTRKPAGRVKPTRIDSGLRASDRARGASAPDPAGALNNIVAHMRDLEREVSYLRSTLAKIGELANHA